MMRNFVREVAGLSYIHTEKRVSSHFRHLGLLLDTDSNPERKDQGKKMRKLPCRQVISGVLE
jgi:hypothetical protein